MLVNKSNFAECFAQLREEICTEKCAAFDTETTALYWWLSPHYAIRPRVFSMQFSTATTDYYFDFGCGESLAQSPHLVLGEEHYAAFKSLFSIRDITWFIHNAKFDMHHCANHALYFTGKMHCTQAIQRIVNNVEDEKGMSLDALSTKYLGASKVDLSEYWKPEDGRVTKVKRPGENNSYYDFLHFDKLPLNILVQYGERDTRLCYRLGKWQLESLEEQNKKYFGNVPSNFGGSLWKLYDNECELTRSLFEIERQGILLDLDFVKAAHKHSCDAIQRVLGELDGSAASYLTKFNDANPKEPLVRMDWNSPIHLLGLFTALGLKYNYTEKGNASFDKDALEELAGSGSEIATKILEYRRHSKRAHTYLENYLWLADTDGVLHCSFAQGGPRTGRMSCRDPNLQNVPKRSDKKEADFVLRKCFKPRPGKVLVSLDCDQAEYRLMLDYAREEALIKRIMEEGLDVHTATQLELSLSDREDAKTLNFQIIYGGGVPKLAYALFRKEITISLDALKAIWFMHKWPRWTNRDGYEKDRTLVMNLPPGEHVRHLEIIKRADDTQSHYFQKLPNVENFVKKVKKKAKDEGVIFTWLGRVLRYGKDSDGRDTSYKAPNGLIQGGVGELSKVAVNRVHEKLKTSASSFLLLQVHDELVAEIDKTEIEIVQSLVDIIEEVYPFRLIKLTAGAAWSENSWGELQEGLPLENGKETQLA